jgi:hypothetical protein
MSVEVKKNGIKSDSFSLVSVDLSRNSQTIAILLNLKCLTHLIRKTTVIILHITFTLKYMCRYSSVDQFIF